MTSGCVRLCGAALVAAALLLGNAQAALAQTLGQGGDVDVPLWRIGGAMVLCSLLAVGGALALRARGGSLPSFSLPFAGPRRRRLKSIETLRLSQNAALSIVECDGRELLILVSQDGSRVLEELPAAHRDAAEVEQRA